MKLIEKNMDFNNIKKIFEDENEKELYEKFSQYTEVLNRWLYSKSRGSRIEEYCNKNHYREIAIYGMSFLGERLLEELEESDVKVLYGIDRQPLSSSVRNKIQIWGTTEAWTPCVDAIIVTPILYFDELKSFIEDRVSCPVLSLKEVIWAL